jgi:hypothetical protein
MTESSLPRSEEHPGSREAGSRAGDDAGRAISITFSQPDIVDDIHPDLLETWGDDPFLAIKDVGFFLRVVLQVRLDDGSRVDFGTWLEIDADDFRTAWRTWNFPEYADLAVEGYPANAIAPWGEFPHVLVKATVRDTDEVPILTSCADMEVMRVIDGIWPQDHVLASYADLLRGEAESGKARRRTAGRRGKRKANTAGPAAEGF